MCLAGIDRRSPGLHVDVNGVAAVWTSTSTWRQTKRRPTLGSSAPGSRPASQRIWKPLQMPSTGPPARANSITDSTNGEKRAAGRPPRRVEDLEAVADAAPGAAGGGELDHRLHDRREARDGAGAQVVAVG